MKNNIIGVFYFKQTDSGNLIGEFTNNKMTTFNIESANNQAEFSSKKYEGKYLTTWLEDGNSHVAELVITQNTINKKSYKLIWKKINSEDTVFCGNGFIVDGILIGNYND